MTGDSISLVKSCEFILVTTFNYFSKPSGSLFESRAKSSQVTEQNSYRALDPGRKSFACACLSYRGGLG
jgi:hypothetical protein